MTGYGIELSQADEIDQQIKSPVTKLYLSLIPGTHTESNSQKLSPDLQMTMNRK